MKGFKWFIITFLAIVLLDTIFDSGKWAIGRYTEVSSFFSIIILILFSCILAGIIELIHRRRRHSEKREEQYYHHRTKVWVWKGHKGNHWDQSLCPDCIYFKPDTLDNCLIESTVHTTDRLNHTVSVVWECPKFTRSKKW